MGILIISIILAIVFGYILNKTNNDVIEGISSGAIALSIMAVERILISTTCKIVRKG